MLGKPHKGKGTRSKVEPGERALGKARLRRDSFNRQTVHIGMIARMLKGDCAYIATGIQVQHPRSNPKPLGGGVP